MEVAAAAAGSMVGAVRARRTREEEEEEEEEEEDGVEGALAQEVDIEEEGEGEVKRIGEARHDRQTGWKRLCEWRYQRALLGPRRWIVLGRCWVRGLDRFEIESTGRDVLRYVLGNSETRNSSESKRSKE